MITVELLIEAEPFAVSWLLLETAVGEASRARARFVLEEAHDPRAWLGRPAGVRARGPHGERRMQGAIIEISATATASPEAARTYEVVIASPCHALTLRHRSRIFRPKTVPQIVEQVLAESGVGGAQFSRDPCAGYASAKGSSSATTKATAATASCGHVVADGVEQVELEDHGPAASHEGDIGHVVHRAGARVRAASRTTARRSARVSMRSSL